ncbi:MAG: hypothetical protein ACXWZF_14710, partial [Actinomycetota bacterium]
MSLDERRLRRLVVPAAVIVVTGAALTLALEVAAGRHDEAVFTVLVLSFPAVGLLVLRRRPDTRLAWL